MLPADSPITTAVLGIVLAALLGVLVWNALRRDRIQYRRFRRLRSTRSRQRVFRTWLLQSLALFGGASIVVLLAAGGFAEPFLAEAALLWPVPLLSALPAGLAAALGIGLLVLLVGGTVLIVVLARRQGEITTVGDVGALLPRNRAELRWGALLSLNAGVVEELLFRLAVPALLFGLSGSALLACVASVALFGVLHLYQGVAGVLASTVLGAAFLLIYIATGSILWAMLVHALVDLRSLVLIPVVLNRVHEKE